MKYLSVLLFTLLSYGSIAQTHAAGRSWVPNWDSLYRGTLYLPFHFTTQEEKNISTGSSKGKVTFISFWFESCAGCRQEFGLLNDLYDSLKQDRSCQFIALTFDDAASLHGYISKYGLHFPIATTGNEDTFRHFNYGMGCPSVIILDKDNRIALISMRALDKKDVVNGFTIPSICSLIRKLEYKNP